MDKSIMPECYADTLLSPDLDILKKYTKATTSIFDKRLVALFGVISSKDENKAVQKLKNWVGLLKKENYQVDINRLKNG